VGDLQIKIFYIIDAMKMLIYMAVFFQNEVHVLSESIRFRI